MQLKVTKLADFLNEALPLSLAKKYMRMEKKPYVKSILDIAFSKYGKDRVYIDLPKEAVEKLRETMLENCNSYGPIDVVLGENGIEIIDFINNVAKEPKQKNFTKITKVLSKLKRPDLLKSYENDYLRKDLAKNKELDFKIVISKSNYDIAGMSTDRKWTSCMKLETGGWNGGAGMNAHYVPRDVENGTIISYIIFSNDTNINNPLGRVLIKPFIDRNDNRNILWFPESACYGNIFNHFAGIKKAYLDTVKSWVEENINKVSVTDKTATFTKNSLLYDDDKSRSKKYEDGEIVNQVNDGEDFVDMGGMYWGTISIEGQYPSDFVKGYGNFSGDAIDMDSIECNIHGVISDASVARLEGEVESVINSNRLLWVLKIFAGENGDVDSYNPAFENWKEVVVDSMGCMHKSENCLAEVIEFIDECVDNDITENDEVVESKFRFLSKWSQGTKSITHKAKEKLVLKYESDVREFVDLVMDDEDIRDDLRNSGVFETYRERIEEDDDFWMDYMRTVNISVSAYNHIYHDGDPEEIREFIKNKGIDPTDYPSDIEFTFTITDISGDSITLTLDQ